MTKAQAGSVAREGRRLRSPAIGRQEEVDNQCDAVEQNQDRPSTKNIVKRRTDSAAQGPGLDWTGLN